MYQFHNENIEIVSYSSIVLTFSEEGRIKTIHGSMADSTGEELQELARKELERAARACRMAKIATLLADYKFAETRANKEAAAKQRNERAAATRAKNKDPFGFDAIRSRNNT